MLVKPLLKHSKTQQNAIHVHNSWDVLVFNEFVQKKHNINILFQK